MVRSLVRVCADAERVVADESDDIARPGLVHRLAFLTEELVGGGEADLLAGALVDDHVALELAGADAAGTRCGRGASASMLAWILKMKPENFGSSTGTSRAVVGWAMPGTGHADGFAAARAARNPCRDPSKSSWMPKLFTAEPK